MGGELTIRLLGGFTLIQHGQPVSELDSARLQALLAYLVLHRGTPQLRYHLAFLFWPDSDEAQARTNLRNLLHRLRRVWPEADRYLTVETKSLTWRADVGISLDVADFEEALGKAGSVSVPEVALSFLQQAISLYQDDLLPSCYDDWISPIRTRLRQAYIQALEQHAELLQAVGDTQGAIRGYRRLAEAEPLQEAIYGRLIDLYESVGDHAAALRVYHQCDTVFRRELGVSPGAMVQEVYRRLLALDGLVSKPPTPSIPEESKLVGRSVAWEQLRLTWQDVAAGRQAPLLALIEGEAGIGKSRLAEELMAWVRRRHPLQRQGKVDGVERLSVRQSAGATTAVASCYAAENQLAFSPVVSWLRGLSLEALTPGVRAELVPMIPDLADADCPLLEPAALPEAWQKTRLYDALTRTILAQEQPILLCLEDIQWCDTETLDWLHHLLRADPHAKLMVVATWRQEEVATDHPLQAALLRWREQKRLLNIPLARLDEADTAELAGTLIGEPLPKDLAAALYAYTEGNPLFIVESIRSGPEGVKAPGGVVAPRSPVTSG
jgi:DNA-binding SARP family transcriptional activator